MKYTLKDIYNLVGKDDKVALLTFDHDSDSYAVYGGKISVVFSFNQKERLQMKKDVFESKNLIKIRYLSGGKLSKRKIKLLKEEGVKIDDISSILSTNIPSQNTFHSEETRTIKTMNIPIEILPKGEDYDWMYGFRKMQVSKNIGLSPKERAFYLAGKYFFEPDSLTKEESDEIFSEEGVFEKNVEWEYLEIKHIREETNDDEKRKIAELYGDKRRNRYQILNKYLQESGSSINKLAKKNIVQATKMIFSVLNFREKRLTITSEHPIYIDLGSYLHIYMRHVQEFQVNKHFEHKDNFQWEKADVYAVLEHVVKEIEEEYQIYREGNPEKIFSKYGSESIYFEGDYYTIHVGGNGRIHTFHKNRKT